MFKRFRPVSFLAVLTLPLTGFSVSNSSQEEIHAIDNVVYNDVDAGIELGVKGAIQVLHIDVVHKQINMPAQISFTIQHMELERREFFNRTLHSFQCSRA